MNLSDDLIFQNLKTAIAFVKMDGSCVSINNAMCDLFGYKKEELLHTDFLNLLHPDDLAKSKAEFIQLVKGNIQRCTSEFRFLHKSGAIYWGSRTISMATPDRIEPQIFMIEIQDMTALHRQTERLQLEHTNRYEKLLKYIPEPLIVCEDGIIFFANLSALQLFRAKEDKDVIGVSIFSFLHPDYHEDVVEANNLLIRTGDPSGFIHRKIYCVTGRLIEIDISSIRIHTMQDKPVILSVLRDMSAKKMAEETLIRSEKLSIIGQLAAGVAHEIRNPLTSLKGFTQLLQERFKHPDTESMYLDIMDKELDRIHIIVNEFMTLARPNLNQFNNAKLESILQSVISILETQAIITNVSLTKKYMEDIPFIYCNENQMKQLFLNIVKNAIESMPGGGEVKITIREAKANHLLIQIKDKGVGMPKNIIDKIGEPFLTTKEDSTGLGLMISQRIIDSHNGSLFIWSREGEGTKVDVYLPISEKI